MPPRRNLLLPSLPRSAVSTAPSSSLETTWGRQPELTAFVEAGSRETAVNRLVMNESGWWRHEMTVVPARIDSHRLEHAIEQGRDPDSVMWPDCRRPYPYYW